MKIKSMIKTAVFGGTTEGRLIAELLFEKGCEVCLFVATDLGEDIAREKGAKFNIHMGRLDQEAIEAVLLKERFDVVIDSTHPYAVEVTKNIKRACQNLNVRLLRLIREDEFFSYALYADKIEDLLNFDFKGNVLFTTGSKETGKLKTLEKDEGKFIRVLPTEASVKAAKEQGFLESNIITGKGPFSVEENVSLIKKHDIHYLISKDSGKTGGLEEKVKACEICKIEIIIIKRPPEEGMTFSQMKDAVEKGTP